MEKRKRKKDRRRKEEEKMSNKMKERRKKTKEDFLSTKQTMAFKLLRETNDVYTQDPLQDDLGYKTLGLEPSVNESIGASLRTGW